MMHTKIFNNKKRHDQPILLAATLLETSNKTVAYGSCKNSDSKLKVGIC